MPAWWLAVMPASITSFSLFQTYHHLQSAQNLRMMSPLVTVAVVLLPYPTLSSTLLWQAVVEVAQEEEGQVVSCRAAWLEPVHHCPLWWALGVLTVRVVQGHLCLHHLEATRNLEALS